jgi:hypothetical protein
VLKNAQQQERCGLALQLTHSLLSTDTSAQHTVLHSCHTSLAKLAAKLKMAAGEIEQHINPKK